MLRILCMLCLSLLAALAQAQTLRWAGRGDIGTMDPAFGGTTDAHGILDPIAHTPDAHTQKGGYNYGKTGDEQLDALIDAAGSEMNTRKRAQLIADAQRRTQSRYFVLPIHRQMITWAARRNVTPVVMPDNQVRGHWIQMQ